jgi:hypothetical protein
VRLHRQKLSITITVTAGTVIITAFAAKADELTCDEVRLAPDLLLCRACIFMRAATDKID